MILLTACGGDDSGGGDEGEQAAGSDTTEQQAELGPDTSYVAEANEDLSEVEVFDEPDAAEPAHRLQNPKRVDDRGNAAPVVFLVEGTEVDGEWIHVHVPVPPNGTMGYVRASDVDLKTHDYRITVRLADHRLELTKGGESLIDVPTGVGQAGFETPPGLYFTTELLQSPNPEGSYGPYAYGISGFQDDPELRQKFGDVDGNAVIGIHGTNEPDKLGTSVSHGCIRVDNETITEMANMLPLGVPVEVVA
ncbi:MAG: L,D-transpeptidase [Acidimicrobiia bacterium]